MRLLPHGPSTLEAGRLRLPDPGGHAAVSPLACPLPQPGVSVGQGFSLKILQP